MIVLLSLTCLDHKFFVSICLCRFQRAKPVIIDPGLYMTKKSDVFWIPQRRSVPTAFKLFTGKMSL